MEDQKNVVKLEDKRLEQVVGGLVEKDEKTKEKKERDIKPTNEKEKGHEKDPGKNTPYK